MDARCWRFGFVCSFLLWGIGCGGGAETPPLGTVSGTVTLDGKPLPDATVRFKPETGRESIATTNADGQYSLRYTMEADGALVGQHRVEISTATEGHNESGGPDDEGTWVEGKPESLPPKYNAESELTATVEEGTNNIDFDLTSN